MNEFTAEVIDEPGLMFANGEEAIDPRARQHRTLWGVSREDWPATDIAQGERYLEEDDNNESAASIHGFSSVHPLVTSLLPTYPANRVIRKRTQDDDDEGEWVQSLPDRIRPTRDIRSLIFRDQITFRREVNSHIVKPDFGPAQVYTH